MDNTVLMLAWNDLIDNIIHDLRTPLAGAGIVGKAFTEIFPEMIKGYRLAVAHQLMTDTISWQRLRKLEQNNCSSVVDNVKSMNNFLQCVNEYMQELRTDTSMIKPLSIKYYIERVLAQDLERYAQVQVDIQHDFTISCVPTFIEHLLLNLLEGVGSALKPAAMAICVWTQPAAQCNMLQVRNTTYTTHAMCQQLFQDFFVTRGTKVLPGLGLCRLALLHANSEMTCTTVEGKYTDFVVRFPFNKRRNYLLSGGGSQN